LLPVVFWLLSPDDFLIASFTAGSGATTYRWKSLPHPLGVKPDINALSVILILVSGLVALWLNISATKQPESFPKRD